MKNQKDEEEKLMKIKMKTHGPAAPIGHHLNHEYDDAHTTHTHTVPRRPRDT